MFWCCAVAATRAPADNRRTPSVPPHAVPAVFRPDVGHQVVVPRQKGFRIILSDPSVEAIFVNIFGGITRGDEVAKGIVEGTKVLNIDKPLVIRLSGTNEEEGRKILSDAGIETAATMEEAAEKIVALTRN